ncbi:sensor histidine kinase [Actinomadura flavalba]|uniref:sensor histidine kinase n=1 Tax=Actinomadura flavalba TaxID=1120938 RepID=UPI000374FC0B|nr:ATP-binding protein [Actinomadura flavalba]
MQVEIVAALTGLAGLAIGLATGLAVRASERAQKAPPASANPGGVPPGVASVLSVLRSSAVVVDGEDRVVRASPAARAFGLVGDDRLGVDELVAMARLVRRDGEIRETELQLGGNARTRAEGRWYAVRVAPLGSSGLVLVLAEDLTETRHVEAVRRDFVANVSHELKTPVGALALLAETVQGAADDPEAVRRFTGRMQHESVRLTSLVQDLMTLSNVQGEEPLPELRPVALDDVVAEAVDRAQIRAGSKHIELTTGGAAGLKVRGDEELLVTALRNLVDNAVAYSPENTRVAVVVEPGGDTVGIAVTDQGIGIPTTELPRIFERFYRVDPARSRQTGGTGLGLAIVKHVATKHHGEVTVWSEEGSGSTFTIKLPLLSPSGGPTPPDGPVPPATPRDPSR